MKILGRSVGVLLGCLLAAPAQAGDEFPFYPSFYPQEITIETVDAASAAARLEKGSLHVYVGGDPFEGKSAPRNIASGESFGAYIVVTPNPALSDRDNRCATALEAARALRGNAFVFHPYPITPYHSDYLQHVDLAERAKKAFLPPASGKRMGPPMRIRAGRNLPNALVPADARAADGAWDASVEIMDARELLAGRQVSLNGWVGPPWVKEGWFHAYLLLAGTMADRGARQLADATFQRLVKGEDGGPVERLINLERKLVALLRGGCERMVAGYTVRREYFSADYSDGVENIARDSWAGFTSPIFPRTVKLKDFPWNGWLTVGMPAKATAAWNPFGGFTDPVGRLIWFALGDLALFPAPHGAGWVPNRTTATLVASGSVEVPPDALIPEHGTGRLKRVGAGTRATAQIRYRVLTSAFHDTTRMTVGDVLYAFSFAYRWGMRNAQGGHDPAVDAGSTLLRERLVGLKALRVEQDVLTFGDVKLTYDVPIMDVYVNSSGPDPTQVAALAPPWSSLPWHVVALMEEAVTRGLAAFSEEEATRRGIAWMDLARDPTLKAALVQLVEDLARRTYIPDSLKEFVTAGEARERWFALRHFYDKHQHFLVTNGPYWLHQWSDTSVVLRVFRDLSYPRGVGFFDSFANPLRGYVTRVERRRDELEVQAEVERVERFGREYRIVREPFSRRSFEQDKRPLPIARYVVVNSDGTVVKGGTVTPNGASTFAIPLNDAPKPGPYTVILALELEANRVNQPVKVLAWTP